MMVVRARKGWSVPAPACRPAGRAISPRHGPQTGSAPGWVRLVREGNLFTAYRSTDGVDMVVRRHRTRSRWPSTVYVGLAVTSHNTSATATATFTNVTARAATTGGNQPPTVSITSPAASATFTAPATMTVTASATDTDGTITKVDFYRGSTLIASDTTQPIQRDLVERGRRLLSADGDRDRQRRGHDDVGAGQRDRQLGDQSGAVGRLVVASLGGIVHGAREHHAERHPRPTPTARSRGSSSTAARRSSRRTRAARIRQSGPAPPRAATR